ALALAVIHIIFRENWQDQDYLDRHCLGVNELRQRVMHEYSPDRVASITGLSVDDIERFACEYARSRELFGGPALIRLNYGLQRDDLFTVVHEQFQTDTADYADILLPATTQLEHFDIHGSYGHLYVQANNAAIAPLGEAKPNTEVFRLLARAMGFEPELFEVSDESLAAGSLGTRNAERGTRNENHEESSL